MSEHKYREWCPFCGNVQAPLDVLARHLDTCEAHAEYRALAGLPDHAASIAELEAQLQYQTRVNASLKEALDQALARCAELERKNAYLHRRGFQTASGQTLDRLRKHRDKLQARNAELEHENAKLRDVERVANKLRALDKVLVDLACRTPKLNNVLDELYRALEVADAMKRDAAEAREARETAKDARIAELESQLADFSALSLEVSTHWEQHLQTHADGPMAQKIAALTALAKLEQRT